jgi:hypothetical protein
MSISRLLRAERLVKRSARVEIPDSYDEAVRQATARRVWAPLPPPEAPPEVVPEPALPASPPPSEPQAEPPPPPEARAWHEDYCRWRTRTAADDADDAENYNRYDIDDPLGIYR